MREFFDKFKKREAAERPLGDPKPPGKGRRPMDEKAKRTLQLSAGVTLGALAIALMTAVFLMLLDAGRRQAQPASVIYEENHISEALSGQEIPVYDPKSPLHINYLESNERFHELFESLASELAIIQETMSMQELASAASDEEYGKLLSEINRSLEAAFLLIAEIGLSQELGAEGSAGLLAELFAELNLTLERTSAELLAYIQSVESQAAAGSNDSITKIEQVYNDLSKLMAVSNEASETLMTSIESQLSEFEITVGDRFDSTEVMIGGRLDAMTVLFGDRLDETDILIGGMDAGLRERINALDASLNTRLSSFQSSVNDNLDLLFTSVSDGKSLLAAALLTKGQTVAKDATFRSIEEAILNIPMSINIGNLPGEIEYMHHYHTDWRGNITNAAEMELEGGCYTSPRYHVHTGSPTSGGGCYTVANPRHTHSTATCPYGTCYAQFVYEHVSCSAPNDPSLCTYRQRYTWECYMHKTEWQVYTNHTNGSCYSHTSYTQNATHIIYNCNISTAQTYALGCGMTTSTAEAWRLGCGLANGQIVGATIVYKDAGELGGGRHYHLYPENAGVLHAPYTIDPHDTASTRRGGCFMVTKIHEHTASCHGGDGLTCGFEHLVWYVAACGYKDGELVNP